MNKWIRFAAPALALAFAGAAWAQVQVHSQQDRGATRGVRLSGEIDFNFAVRHRVAEEIVRDDTFGGQFGSGGAAAAPGGAAPASGTVGAPTTRDDPDRETSAFFWGHVTLRAVADLDDNIQAVVEIGTVNRDDGALSEFDDGLADFVSLRLAYVDIPQFLWENLRLRAGLQEVYWNLRDRSRSGAFFLDVNEAGNPWVGVNRDRHIVRLDRGDPVGARLTFSWENWGLDFYLIPEADADATGVSDSIAANNAIYAGQFEYRFRLGDSRSDSRLQGTVAYFSGGFAGLGESSYVLAQAFGGSAPLGGVDVGLAVDGFGDEAIHDANVWTFGAGLDLMDVAASGLEIFGEIYWQTGRAGDSAAAGVGDLDADGWAFQVGFRYDWGTEGGTPWYIGAKYTFYNGDDDTADGDYDGFIGYGNLGDLLILENQVLGFGINTNLRSLKFEGGVTVQGWGRPLDLRAVLAFSDADEATPVNTAGNSRDLGTELDITATYHINSQVTFTAAGAWLWSADLLDNPAFTADARDDTWLLNFGLNVKW
jgi:hypothetical protein